MAAGDHPSVRFSQSLEALGRAAGASTAPPPVRDPAVAALIVAGNRLANALFRVLEDGRGAPPALVREWDEARERFGAVE
jgi:hypothetical protein